MERRDAPARFIALSLGIFVGYSLLTVLYYNGWPHVFAAVGTMLVTLLVSAAMRLHG
jgi:hypothetical protein